MPEHHRSAEHRGMIAEGTATGRQGVARAGIAARDYGNGGGVAFGDFGEVAEFHGCVAPGSLLGGGFTSRSTMGGATFGEVGEFHSFTAPGSW